jgi:hypothetical protein
MITLLKRIVGKPPLFDPEEERTEESVIRPSVYDSLAWWGRHIDIVDPMWRLKALALYHKWLKGDKISKSSFLSDFLNDVDGELEAYADEMVRGNPAIVAWEWSSRFSYKMTYFHHLYDEYYSEKPSELKKGRRAKKDRSSKGNAVERITRRNGKDAKRSRDSSRKKKDS